MKIIVIFLILTHTSFAICPAASAGAIAAARRKRIQQQDTINTNQHSNSTQRIIINIDNYPNKQEIQIIQLPIEPK